MPQITPVSIETLSSELIHHAENLIALSVDAYRPRLTREAGLMLASAVAGFRNDMAKANTPPFMFAAWADSIAEMSGLIEDMLNIGASPND